MNSNAIPRRKQPTAACRGQRGISMVLVLTIASAVMLGCLALLGAGFAIVNKIHLTNVGNLAALGAVSGMMAEQDPNNKVQAAELGAARVLQENKLIGTETSIDQISADGSDWGQLTFGQYFPKNPGSSGPCGSDDDDYPCFLEIPRDQLASAFAVEVELDSSGVNPQEMPFGGTFGSGVFGVSSETVAAVVPRCIVTVLDMSLSTTGANYRADSLPEGGASNPCCNVDPDKPCHHPDNSCTYDDSTEYTKNRGMFVFDADKVEKDDGTLILEDDCSGVNGPDYEFSSLVSPDTMIWCLLAGDTRPSTQPVPFDETLHYRSDYRKVTFSSGEAVYVDQYTNRAEDFYGPQPWYDVLSGVNAMLREVRNQATSGDQVRFIAFDADLMYNSPQFSSDFDRYIQLTNPDNRGTVDQSGSTTPEIHPNFLDEDYGWYPRGTETSYTNLELALRGAVRYLTDPTKGCPAHALKIGVLATDGLTNCRQMMGGLPSQRCGGDYEDFLESRYNLLQSPVFVESDMNEIQWVVLHFGQSYVDPHIINKPDPEWTSDMGHPGQYLIPQRASEVGFVTYKHPQPAGDPDANFSLTLSGYTNRNGSFVNVLDDDYLSRDAFDYMGRTDTHGTHRYFHGASGFLYDLSRRGVYCPLTSAGHPDFYYSTPDEDGRQRLRDDVRGGVTVERRSLYLESIQMQAAQCMRKLVKDIPYTLYPEPVKYVRVGDL